jgi:uncharacterized protein
MRNWLENFFFETWSILLEMAPYLLIGFLLAGLLSVLVKQDLIERWLGNRSLGSVIKASLLGVPLPLCSCGVIPVTVSLYQRGASKGATTSFLTSTPQTGVDSILATTALMGPLFSGVRVGVALLSGIIAGALVDLFEKDPGNTPLPKIESTPPSTDSIKSKLMAMIRYACYTLPQDIGKNLVIGIILAGLLSTLLPENWGASYLSDPWLTYSAVTLVAIPLYVCSTGSIPIAFALMTSGVSPGAALVFLIAGPATNIATITTLGKLLGRKTILIYLGSIILISWISGFLLDAWGGSQIVETIEHHHSSSENSVIQLVSAIALLLMLAWSSIFPKVSTHKPKTMKNSADTHLLKVEGMTCSHCASSVNKALSQLPGVESVEADPAKNQVWIKTSQFNQKLIAETINAAGFEFKGIV